jgi:GNAT superfamily N-acetyltransferase
MAKFINDSLVHMWRGLQSTSGYEISQIDGMHLLKSPTSVVNLNVCVEPSKIEHVLAAKIFFQGKDFGSIETPGFEWDSIPIKAAVDLVEMHLSTDNIAPVKMPQGIYQAHDHKSMLRWAELLKINFGLDQEALFSFAQALTHLKRAILLYAVHEKQIVGTGQVYIDDQNLSYISAISVLPEYRRLHIGSKLMQAAIHYSIEQGAKLLALHASEMGRFLYHHLNFKQIKTWKFKIIDNSKQKEDF